MSFTRLLLAAFAGSLLAEVGFARRTLRRPLSVRLGSCDARLVTAAVGEIVRQRRPGWEPDLLRCLQTWSTRPDAAAEPVRTALLEALLRLDAAVPAAALRRVRRGAGAELAFELLVRSARVNERALLAVFRLGVRRPELRRGPRWTRAGDLLCSLRTPGFAAALLAVVDWRGIVTVDDGSATRLAPTASAAAPRAVARWLGELLPATEVRLQYTECAAAGDPALVEAARARVMDAALAARRRVVRGLAAAGALSPLEVAAAARMPVVEVQAALSAAS